MVCSYCAGAEQFKVSSVIATSISADSTKSICTTTTNSSHLTSQTTVTTTSSTIFTCGGAVIKKEPSEEGGQENFPNGYHLLPKEGPTVPILFMFKQ